MNASTVGEVPIVTDDSVDDVTQAPLGVLILGKSDCGHCTAYAAAVAGLISAGRLPGVVTGKLLLDRPGGGRFKRDNPWVRDLEHLPHTVVYADGKALDAFSASKASYLLERLAAVRARVGADRPALEAAT